MHTMNADMLIHAQFSRVKYPCCLFQRRSRQRSGAALIVGSFIESKAVLVVLASLEAGGGLIIEFIQVEEAKLNAAIAREPAS